jgi:hypothetical protein
MEIVIVLRDARRAALIASLLPELKRLSFLVRGHQSGSVAKLVEKLKRRQDPAS